jgi:phosphoribosylanthranilate isomerase
MTSGEAVRAALEAGADAIGFVFAASPRRVEPAQAAQLARAARGRVRCVAVTLHPRQSELDAILRLFDPDVLQTDLEDFGRLALPDGLARLPVVRAPVPPRAILPHRLLFEGPRSGSGTMSDWHEAALLAPTCELVLAGGLDARSVGPAITAVRPFGVDVSSGVEDAPGVKSAQKIREFVRAARAASSEIEHEPVHDRRGS